MTTQWACGALATGPFCAHSLATHTVWCVAPSLRMEGPLSPNLWRALSFGPIWYRPYNNDHCYMAPTMTSDENVGLRAKIDGGLRAENDELSFYRMSDLRPRAKNTPYARTPNSQTSDPTGQVPK
eukprot:3775119-Pyramimonas_sp.AAC.2